ncbi:MULTISPECIES: adenosylcobinamide-GDP ribazoletransferase [unclassified Devosia]|uniref:adenosylcobinamide-GDP ribazoletransferase n=1 Tax=unclassified Devosia TaxID=196773 RepID=UPI001554EC39|nr:MULTISPECIES: adenosylcobinamide-GDP ribazoletransferase [unclassified Devosia]
MQLNGARPRRRHAVPADLLMAIRFFSRLPTGSAPHELPQLDRMAPVLPLASILIGLAPAFTLFVAPHLGMPPLLAAALAVAVLVVAGGAMAEDALADSADGLFGGHTVERRLEIMKDSRHGTYGVAALCLLLLMRVAALASLAAIDPLGAAILWLGAQVLARSGALWLAVALPPARRDGASAAAGSLSRAAFAIGLAFALMLFSLSTWPLSNWLAPLLALPLAGVATLAWARLCRRLLGGQTGDVVGGLVALLEIVVLAVLVCFAAGP